MFRLDKFREYNDRGISSMDEIAYGLKWAIATNFRALYYFKKVLHLSIATLRRYRKGEYFELCDRVYKSVMGFILGESEVRDLTIQQMFAYRFRFNVLLRKAGDLVNGKFIPKLHYATDYFLFSNDCRLCFRFSMIDIINHALANPGCIKNIGYRSNERNEKGQIEINATIYAKCYLKLGDGSWSKITMDDLSAIVQQLNEDTLTQTTSYTTPKIETKELLGYIK